MKNGPLHFLSQTASGPCVPNSNQLWGGRGPRGRCRHGRGDPLGSRCGQRGPGGHRRAVWAGERAAREGWNEQQQALVESRTLLDSSEAVLGGPGPRGKAAASCPQDRQCRARTVVRLLFPVALPAPGQRRCLRGGVARREVSAGCFPDRSVRRRQRRALLPASSWVRAQEPRGAAVTALRRRPARPAGPRRGRRWHTTGADHWSYEILLQVSSSHCPAETECSPTHEKSHPA